MKALLMLAGLAVYALPASAQAAPSVLRLEQPPVTVGLHLEQSEPNWVRLNLPAWVETIELSRGRSVHVAARANIPALLEVAGREIEVAVTLGAVEAVADARGHVQVMRRLDLTGPDLGAGLDLEMTIDLSTLGGGEPYIQITQGAVVALTGRARLAGASLSKAAAIARPIAPLPWRGPRMTSRWTEQAGHWNGRIELGGGLYPEVFADDDGVVVSLSLANGETRALRLSRSEASSDSERWVGEDAAIVWTKRGNVWTAAVTLPRVSGTRQSTIELRLGDAMSPMSLDTVAKVGAAEQHASL